jgi:hypothetical protein
MNQKMSFETGFGALETGFEASHGQRGLRSSQPARPTASV